MKVAILLVTLAVAAQAAILRNVEVNQMERIEEDTRIVNGQPAAKGQFPHQASIVVDDKVYCGGSLISVEWVVTAAHCADGSARKWDVTLGAQELSANEPDRVTITTTTAIIHNGFINSSLDNDIALLRLTGLVLTEWIQIVNLPTRTDESNLYVGAAVTVSGWGKNIDNTTVISEELYFVNLNVISNSDCQRTYGSIVTNSTICCSGSAGVGTCNGDSGGPLILDGANPKLVGIVSFVAITGCESGLPSGFERVTSHLDWISGHTGIVIQD